MDEQNTIPNPYENVNPNFNSVPPAAAPTNASATPSSGGTPQNTRTLVTVLLLIFLFPVGFFVMWFWSHWKVWIKVMITAIVPLIFVAVSVLLAVVLVAVNPTKQFSHANNAKRASDVNATLSAVYQYGADNRGDLTPLGLPAAGEPEEIISSANGYTAFCDELVPMYITALPVDPLVDAGTPVSSCGGTWDTGYAISQDNDGKIMVSAPETELDIPVISVTR